MDNTIQLDFEELMLDAAGMYARKRMTLDEYLTMLELLTAQKALAL